MCVRVSWSCSSKVSKCIAYRIKHPILAKHVDSGSPFGWSVFRYGTFARRLVVSNGEINDLGEFPDENGTFDEAEDSLPSRSSPR